MRQQPVSDDRPGRTLIWALALLCAVLAHPAHALSCLRPDPARSFDEAAAAAESYVVLYGRFAFNAALLPDRMGAEGFVPNDVTEVPARFTGNGLTSRGFTVPVVRDVTLRFECLGPWCGSTIPDIPALAFVEQVGADYTLTIGPCGGQLFGSPEAEMLELMPVCMANGRCPS